MPADAAGVDDRIDELSHILECHAGGLELGGVDEGGAVNVRFTGMCTGCPLRPVTLAGLVKPALLAVPGVTEVTADGGRMSAEAEARMAEQYQAYGSFGLLTALTEPS
jgi:Fe-S cluster biogenesis protein NfuA